MKLNEYQRRANLTDQRPGNGDDALVFPLMGLASDVGSLVTQFKKRVRDGDAHALFTSRAGEELGDILWYVANLSHKLGLDLEDIAELNLRRTGERWPLAGQVVPEGLFDDAFPAGEQLPRVVSVRFEEVEVDGRIKVQISRDGEQIGDYLSDMNYSDDGYRYHDVFHLAYAALLGWSPVSRAFFKVKRDSDSRLREVEDGGRSSSTVCLTSTPSCCGPSQSCGPGGPGARCRRGYRASAARSHKSAGSHAPTPRRCGPGPLGARRGCVVEHERGDSLLDHDGTYRSPRADRRRPGGGASTARRAGPTFTLAAATVRAS